MVEIVIEKSESLNNFPKIGRVVPEQNNNNIRELFIYSYRLIYQIINPDVEIIAFIHGARDLTSEEFKDLTK